MKTKAEKVQDQINEINLNIEQALQERQKHYDKLKDFKLSANKTDIVLAKMADLTRTITSGNKKIKELQGV